MVVSVRKPNIKWHILEGHTTTTCKRCLAIRKSPELKITLVNKPVEDQPMNPRIDDQVGLGALWIVTKATEHSELIDVCFRATPKDLAQMVLGGLGPDEILGWFDNYSEANQIALQELHRAGVNTGRKMDDPRTHSSNL